MSNNTNSTSTEMASQLAEAAQLLTSTADRLADTAGDLEDIQCKLDDVNTELEDIQYKLSKANAELHMLACPRECDDSWIEDDDSLYDPKNYLTALEVSGLAKYFMSREKAEGIPVPKLQKLLYNVSVLNGWPMILRDQEPAFYTDIAIECLKKIARLKDSYMQSVLEGEDEF